MSYSTPDPDNFVSDGGDLIEGYNPFIADVTLQIPSEPFHSIKHDFRSDEEIDRVRHSLRTIVCNKEFDPPVALADYCLIAKQKWEEETLEEQDTTIRVCSLQ